MHTDARLAVVFWGCLSLALLLLSTISCHLSLYGDWPQTIFQATKSVAFIWDPDTAYLASGITFFEGRYPAFVGHPGTPLMLTIQIVTQLMYGVSSFLGSSIPFAEYAARHIPSIIWACKLTITLCHLFSFFVLYQLTRKFLQSQALAYLSVLIYATSFNVLFYLNKISPEPFLVTFILATLLCLLRTREAIKQKLSAKTIYSMVTLCALLTAAANITKITVAPPVFLFGLIFFLFVDNGESDKSRYLSRPSLAVTYAILSCAFVIIFGLKTDWQTFYSFWFTYAPGSPKFSSDHMWSQNIINRSGYILRSFANILGEKLSWNNLFPASSPIRYFVLAEAPFAVIALIGFTRLWHQQPSLRPQMVWTALYIACLTPLAIYRSDLHYFFPHLALSAGFCAFGLTEITMRLSKGFKDDRRIAKGILIVLVITLHAFSIVCFVERNKVNYREFAKFRGFYDGLSALGPNELIGYRSLNVWGSLGHIDNYLKSSNEFMKELNKLFIQLPAQASDRELSAKKISLILENNGGAIIYYKNENSKGN